MLRLEGLFDADFILGTHNHIEHIDWKIWRKIAAASAKPTFILPQALIDEMGERIDITAEQLVGRDDGASFESGGLKISAITSAHEFLKPEDSPILACGNPGYYALSRR